MIENYLTYKPQVDSTAWVHKSAVVIGQVILASDVSVWPCAVIRGDVNTITIGERTNIQDGTVIHVTQINATNKGSPTVIGNDVTIGHGVILHGCKINNYVLIGMGSTVLDGVTIEDEVMVGAASLVPMNKTLESGYLYIGSPVKKVRELTDEEKQFLRYSAKHYSKLKDDFKSQD